MVEYTFTTFEALGAYNRIRHEQLHTYKRKEPIANTEEALEWYKKNKEDKRKNLFSREHERGYSIYDHNGIEVAEFHEVTPKK